MNSILPSNQTVCTACGMYKPPDASVCEGCGAKIEARSKRSSFDTGAHLMVSLTIIFVGAMGFFRYYPPGKLIWAKGGGRYHSTDMEVFIWGIFPLTIGSLYLLFAILLKIKDRFFS